MNMVGRGGGFGAIYDAAGLSGIKKREKLKKNELTMQIK